MSDKNSSLINLPDLPDSIDTAVKNLTDKPTQGVERLGIIALDTSSYCSDKSVYIPYEKTSYYENLSLKARRCYASKVAAIHKYLGYFTPLGKNFFEVCVK